jgi:hypothetical protein
MFNIIANSSSLTSATNQGYCDYYCVFKQIRSLSGALQMIEIAIFPKWYQNIQFGFW